ncbi:HNH endonuclease family protein [Shewanella cyperi]|uniref:hypothetical protein n=1 Tax=Shewanella cyperi TaxID=2814292 RepID=UPI001A946C28|nr:hypothetical protein [Shewanella cyperi]QSX41517.1 hypothetical protein JYB84_03520 [Shewanella cyperi]
MFNVVRTNPAPQPILDGIRNHNHPLILEELSRMFYSKCYICEVLDPQACAVEHFDATNADRVDWNNLYFACHRCNSNFKNANYNNLIDPADPNTDVFRAIKHKFPTTPNSHVEISRNEAVQNSPSISQTIELIDKVFNDDSTGNRKITRTMLRKKLFSILVKVFKEISVISDDDSTPQQKKEAEEKIIHFLRVEQEFSAFIRWMVLDDQTLRRLFEQYIRD